MIESEDDPDGQDAQHAEPYRAEDFVSLQYVPPTAVQRGWAELKVAAAVAAVIIVVAMCAHAMGFA